MQKHQRLVHPVGLPTLLPTGRVRVRLLAARQDVGAALFNPEDHNITPEHLSRKPFTTPERFLVLGTVAWDEIYGELTFNIVDGCLARTTEGWPVILKLSKTVFFNVTSGTVMEFDASREDVTIHQNGSIKGPPATRLYRMLDELVIRDRQKWRRMFPPDPDTRDSENRTLCNRCQGSCIVRVGDREIECRDCEGSGMKI
ncbi:MAG: hypothetical protein JNJ77_20075 [Planctomycetia bacterium]|nr:hypothetical protein [Planctomycetia bacterium]